MAFVVESTAGILSEWEKTTNWSYDGDLIQFQFDQVLFRRGSHFSPPKSTRWSRNSEIWQARSTIREKEMVGRKRELENLMLPQQPFRLDEYLCSSRGPSSISPQFCSAQKYIVGTCTPNGVVQMMQYFWVI